MPVATPVPAVVLTSHVIGLAVIRALGMMGVPISVAYYQDIDMGSISKYVRHRIKTPHPERDQQGFLDVLIGSAPRHCRPVLIPGDEATLSVVSKHKTTLQPYYIVASSDASVTEILINKRRTYEIAEKVGLPFPKTTVPASIEDVERYSVDVDFPCLIKPCRSHQYFELFGTKMVKVNSASELIAEYRRATAAGTEVMIQELIPGDDSAGANYNSFVWNDEPLAEFTAEKVRLAPPLFGVPRVVVSKDIPEIVEPGRRLLRAMGFRGYSCTEFKKDARDGVYKLMEVNGRHNRSGLLALHCGINFPWIEYQCLVGGSVERRSSKPPDGVYWIDEFNDVRYTVQCAKHERYTFTEYVRPYVSSHIFAIYSASDLRPFIKRCIDAVKIAFAPGARVKPTAFATVSVQPSAVVERRLRWWQSK